MGVAEDTKARAEQGKDLLASQRASGEPGTPNKQATDSRVSAQETLKQLDDLAQRSVARQRGPAATATDYHPVPAHERTTTDIAPAATGQMDSAAGAISAARTAMTAQVTSDARLRSDPRYERDQKIFEMGRQGHLAFVPPSEAEKAALAARAGLPAEVMDKLPATPQDQVADDMKRLEQGKERAKTLNPVIEAGEQDNAPKNNFTKDKEAGANTGDRAPKDSEAKTFDTGTGRNDIIQ